VRLVLIKIVVKEFIYHVLFITPFIGEKFYRFLNRNRATIQSIKQDV
jgi:hypothetical protein